MIWRFNPQVATDLTDQVISYLRVPRYG